MKSTELAKELGIKSSEIVAEAARLRGVVFKKGTTTIKLTADEAEIIRTVFLERQRAAAVVEMAAMSAVAESFEPLSGSDDRVEDIPIVPPVEAEPEPELPTLAEVDASSDEDGSVSLPVVAEELIEPSEENTPAQLTESAPVPAMTVDDVMTVVTGDTGYLHPVAFEVPDRGESVVVPDQQEETAPEVTEIQEIPEPEAVWHGERHSLETNHLGKSYGKKTAVKDVSFSVHTGEVVGLLGPNGAGKTTTFYMVVGAIKPDQGEILLNGTDIRSMPMYKRALNGLGYLPQEPSIFRKLTVRQNLKAVLEIRRKSEHKKEDRLEIDEEVQGFLEEFHLTEFADRDGYRLSGGERRRTEIARAVALRPTFLLFDEPFAGIDPIAIIELKKMIIYLKRKGLGILITDHNVRETLSITDRAYIIKDGTVFASGHPEALVDNPEVREAYLGEDFRLS